VAILRDAGEPNERFPRDARPEPRATAQRPLRPQWGSGLIEDIGFGAERAGEVSRLAGNRALAGWRRAAGAGWAA